MHGPDDRIIPGNALAVHEDLPFTSVVKFGTGFLNKFEAAQCNAPLLERTCPVPWYRTVPRTVPRWC